MPPCLPETLRACACATLLVGVLASGCKPGTLVVGDPSSPVGPGPIQLWVAADGGATVYLDGEVLGTADGWREVTAFEATLEPGRHTLALRLDGEGEGTAGAAATAWASLPDGSFLVSDGDWEAATGVPADCWIDGSCEGGGIAASERGGFGTPPWLWDPPEMAWSAARWLQVDDDGGAGWLRAHVDLARHHVGRWSIEPGTAVAGEAEAFTLVFLAGSDGVAAGESRSLFQTPLDGSRGRNMPYARWSPWQVDDPEAEGYLSIAEAPEGVELQLRVVEQPEGGPATQISGGRLELILDVVDGQLAPGAQVELTWGEGGTVLAPLQARRHVFPHPASENDPSPDYPGLSLARSPGVRVEGGDPAALHVAVRGGAAVGIGEAVTVHVVVLDGVGNPSPDEVGPLTVETSDPDAVLPETVEIPAGATSATFEVRFGTAGLHRIALSGEIVGSSGWVRVEEFVPDATLLFGDFHAHSLASDGIWPWEETYRHADQVGGLDFTGLTDHGERLTTAEWEAAVARAAALDRPGFLVLAGYEWTSREAKHRCVYATSDEPPEVVRSGNFEYQGDTVEAVEAFWDGVGDEAFTIPHHPGSLVGPEHGWLDHEGDREPVVEIYSKHGSSECLACQPAILPDWAWGEGNYVRDGLAMGLRVGFVAGSDGHETPLGGLAPDHRDVFDPDDHGMMVWRGGLTAVWAPELARDALFDALRARRCYATTGARILVDLTVDGEPMGAEVALDGPPTFEIAVGGTAELGVLELVRYTASTGWTAPLSLDPVGDQFETTWIDDTLSGEAAIYYLRVIQEDGHHAWSSPVWLDP